MYAFEPHPFIYIQSTSLCDLPRFHNYTLYYTSGFPLQDWELDLDSGRVVLVALGVPGVDSTSILDCTKFTIISNRWVSR